MGDTILYRISSPIEHRPHNKKGEPWAVLQHDWPLTNRQRRLLGSLPDAGSRIVVRRSGVSMSDLAALTAETGDEFAMFTRGPKRLIMRGDYRHVDMSETELERLSTQGYKWSGHTHPGLNLIASEGDYDVLAYFTKNQKQSVIYNARGRFNTF